MELNFWVDHFYRASLFAKAIYALLVGLSIYAWAIMFRKGWLFRKIARENVYFFGLYRKNRHDPFSLYRNLKRRERPFSSPLVSLFLKGCEEMETQTPDTSPEGKRSGKEDIRLTAPQLESIEEVLYAEMDKFHDSLESGQTFLATTSSISPLLGLLGTVWGILEAFRSIGLAGSATAASMAPGLSEALITTVVGLMVAIPANLGYNFLGQRAKDLTMEGDSFITEFITNLRRFGEVA